MPIGPITPGDPVDVTPDIPPITTDTIQCPTATMPVKGSDLQSVTLALLTNWYFNWLAVADSYAFPVTGAHARTGGVYNIVTVPDVTALSAITSVAGGFLCIVATDDGGAGSVTGMYRLDTSSTMTADGWFVVEATGPGGNWIRVGNGTEPAHRQHQLSTGTTKITVSGAPNTSGAVCADSVIAPSKAVTYTVALQDPTFRVAGATTDAGYQVTLFFRQWDSSASGTIDVQDDGGNTRATVYANKTAGPQSVTMEWDEADSLWVLRSASVFP